jgi:hypothetical protein
MLPALSAGSHLSLHNLGFGIPEAHEQICVQQMK